MRKQILAICDSNREYLVRLQEYLNRKRNIPFAVYVFTSLHECCAFAENKVIDVAVLSEDVWQQDTKLPAAKTILLSETDEYKGIYKYRSGEHFIKRLCELCGEEQGNLLHTDGNIGVCKLIGFYSPIKRCLQTSYAMVLGQILARNRQVLYLNFEPYAGFEHRILQEGTSDLSDLMYYLKNLEDRFEERFQSTIQSINGLTYVPPALSLWDIGEIRAEEWLKLLDKLSGRYGYEYLVLDLSDQVQGLPDILRNCECVYTITKTDIIAQAKTEQYEKLLQSISYSDVLEKTKKLELPLFHGMNQNIDKLLYTDLAEHVRKTVREDFSNIAEK